jgi:hypothetical protein
MICFHVITFPAASSNIANFIALAAINTINPVILLSCQESPTKIARLASAFVKLAKRQGELIPSPASVTPTLFEAILQHASTLALTGATV